MRRAPSGSSHHRALRHLEPQPARVQPRVGQRAGDELDEAGVGQLAVRDVDRHRDVLAARVLAPDRELAAGLVEHEAPERQDQPGLVGDRHELARLDHLAGAVGPAAERLEARDGAGRSLDHRLVEHPQLAAVERVAQAGLELEPLHHPRVHRLVEHGVAGAALRLGAVHGDVGVAHDVLRRAVGGHERDADAGRHVELAVVDVERRGERLLQALGDDRGAADVLDLLEQQRELVAAVAGDGVAGAQRTFDALGDGHQQAVADEVAERVVDELEAVEVAEQHGAAELVLVAARALEAELQAVEEERAVGQPGQGVVERVVAQLRQLAERARRDDRVGRARGFLGRGRPTGAHIPPW